MILHTQIKNGRKIVQYLYTMTSKSGQKWWLFAKKIFFFVVEGYFSVKSEWWKDISSEIILFNFSEYFYFGDFL